MLKAVLLASLYGLSEREHEAALDDRLSSRRRPINCSKAFAANAWPYAPPPPTGSSTSATEAISWPSSTCARTTTKLSSMSPYGVLDLPGLNTPARGEGIRT
jgi:hypothetical protein